MPNLPLGLLLLAAVLLVIRLFADSWRAALAIVVGVIVAYACASLFVRLYVPEPNQTSLVFTLCWAILSVVFVWLAVRAARFGSRT